MLYLNLLTEVSEVVGRVLGMISGRHSDAQVIADAIRDVQCRLSEVGQAFATAALVHAQADLVRAQAELIRANIERIVALSQFMGTSLPNGDTESDGTPSVWNASTSVLIQELSELQRLLEANVALHLER